MIECNICGGKEFVPGPGNRLSQRKKLPPLCAKCRSTERPRVGRSVASKLRVAAKFSAYNAVVWGDSQTVAKGWFRSVELFAAADADAKMHARADESVSFLVSENTLHRSADHRKIVTEMARVLTPDGLMMLSYPNPLTRENTEDWGQPDAKRAGAFRIIGRDFESEFATIAPEMILIRVEEADPVTGDKDIVYIGTRNPFWMRKLFQVDLDSRILD